MQDEKRQCGLCGGLALYPPERLVQSGLMQRARPPREGRRRAIALLIAGVAVLAQGALWVFLPLDPALTAIGFFMMAFGAIMLLVITGVFGGMPYRSRILNRADRELKRRERRKYAD